MQTKLQITRSIDERKWEEFVSGHSSGTIFQTFSMYKLYSSVPGYRPYACAVVNEEGEIQGLMLSCIIAEKGVKTYFSSRSIINGGPLINRNDMLVARMILENYLQEVRRKAIYSQFRNVYLRDNLEEVFIQKGFDYHDHYTVVINLHKNEEELLKMAHKKKRNNIRRSLKKGVVTRRLSGKDEIESAIELIQSTYSRIKLPGPPRELLSNARIVFGQHLHFFGSFYNNEMIAAKIVLTYKSLVYDWYSGHNPSFSYLCGNDLLVWDCIKWARANGFEAYDMGGAGKPGVYYGVRDFKLKFGGQLQNTGRYMQVHKSLLYMAGSSFIHFTSKT